MHHMFARSLQACSYLIDSLNRSIGYAIAWLAIAMMLTCSTIVLLRDGFNTGSLWLQDGLSYMHASLFMLGAAYAFQQDAHVRVDIFYRRFSARTRAWIDSLGSIIFLLPLCIFIFWMSWGYVAQSWSIKEVSADAGGLPAVYLLKTLLLAMPVLLGLQAISHIARQLITLMQDDV